MLWCPFYTPISAVSSWGWWLHATSASGRIGSGIRVSIGQQRRSGGGDDVAAAAGHQGDRVLDNYMLGGSLLRVGMKLSDPDLLKTAEPLIYMLGGSGINFSTSG
jgi:hypothetical protein